MTLDPLTDPLDDDPFAEADDPDADLFDLPDLDDTNVVDPYDEMLGFLAGDYAGDAHLLGFGPF